MRKDGEHLKSSDVLKFLAIGGVIGSSLVFPGLPGALTLLSQKYGKGTKRELGIIVRRFIKQEVLALRELEDGEVQIELLEKGKRRLLTYDFESLEMKNKKIDNKLRLVIFDIPEGLKKNREVFRKKLLQLNFKWVQDSVFVSFYSCKDEIDFLTNFLEIKQYVTLLTVDQFESGEELFVKKVA